MSGKIVNVAVIGAGVVGSSFLNQIIAMKSPITYSLIYVGEADNSLISKDYSPLKLDANWRKSLNDATDKTLTMPELIEFLKKSPLPTILVDNTSSAYISGFYPKVVEAGISVATPNKKAFSSNLDMWKEIFAGRPTDGLVYHEATVGAGLPILSFMREIIQTGDEVEKIEGIFSGTLSYIFNEFSTIAANDVKFSDVVKVAKELGYTEPDPRDDLNGLDVARKVTIVARIAGLPVENPQSFPVQSLIPQPLETVETAAEFLEKLPAYDVDLTKLKEEAAKEQKVLRFIGKVDVKTNKVSVGIEKYDYSHPFAGLKGSDNVISIKTKRYTNPVVIQGAGAGADVTAAGILGDVIKIAQRL
ncbi:homoserine dehydrogenase [Maudiozyma humilis]|uniref:Homoserine dehydrogenase n=1 Tax=Maudiozyma humilis TaxID=51915 RepID=A0AAV5RSV9_MAUHU|nr:homoserine dehydrogenase [Kazachstania humilis]